VGIAGDSGHETEQHALQFGVGQFEQPVSSW
jgi:hypothetical protein